MSLRIGSLEPPTAKAPAKLRTGSLEPPVERKTVRSPKQAPDIIGGYCPYCGIPPSDHPKTGCDHLEKVIMASAVMYRRLTLMLDLCANLDPGARRARLLKLYQETGNRLALEMQLPIPLISAIQQLENEFKRFAESK